MPSTSEIRRTLRALLAAPEVVAAPGVGDPITARLAASLDFPAVHVSGSIAHRTSGYADAGILTMHEMTDRIAAMAAVVDVALIADADTGFGGAVNVVRTVKEYERAGAAAVHIEDPAHAEASHLPGHRRGIHHSPRDGGQDTRRR